MVVVDGRVGEPRLQLFVRALELLDEWFDPGHRDDGSRVYGSPMITVRAASLGECWLQTSAAILEHGEPSTYDGLPIKEVAHMALSAAEPDPDDPLIARLGDPAWSAWMHENFFTPAPVADSAARGAMRRGSSITPAAAVISWRGSWSGCGPTRRHAPPRSPRSSP